MLLALSAAWAMQPSADRLLDDIRHLTGDLPIDGSAIASRSIHHDDHERAGVWLEARLRQAAGNATRDPFTMNGVDTDLYNLVAVQPGLTDAGTIVVAAHWDSTANLTDGWDPARDGAPGADDDASGVAAVLEIARLLRDRDFTHTIRYVLFDAEEVGLVGSKHHAAGMAGADIDIQLMLALDPVGFNPGDWLMWSYDDRFLPESDAMEASTASAQTWLMVTAVDRMLIGGDSRSDHHPFWELGYPALHLGTFPQPASYHTTTDTLDNVDVAFTSEITRLVATHVAELAVELPDEQGGGCSCRSVAGSTSWLLLLAVVGAVRRLPLRRRSPCPIPSTSTSPSSEPAPLA